MFIAAPLRILTGFTRAGSRQPLARFSILLHRERCPSLHFLGALFFNQFILIHVTMGWSPASENSSTISGRGRTRGTGRLFLGRPGSVIIALLWFAATWITMHRSRLVHRVGRLIVGRITFLMEWFSPNRQYKDSDISPYFWTNGTLPEYESWDRLIQAVV